MEEDRNIIQDQTVGSQLLVNPAPIFTEKNEQEQIEILPQKRYVSIPSSIPVKVSLSILGSGGEREVLSRYAARTEEISKGKTSLAFYESTEEGQLLAEYKSGNVESTLLFPEQMDNSVNAQKFLCIALDKANRQCLVKGVLASNELATIAIPLQELINCGMYSDMKTAKRGFYSAFKTLSKLDFRILRDNRSKKEDQSNDTNDPYEGTLFIGRWVEDGIGYVDLNPRAKWAIINREYSGLPQYYPGLSSKAFYLSFCIAFNAKFNMEQIKERGYFDISLKTIVKDLQLPEVEGNPNANKTVKGVILSAINEINEKQLSFMGNDDLRLEIVYDADPKNSVKKFIDYGKLRVYTKGEYADYFIAIEQKKAARIQASKSRRARQKRREEAEKNK